MADKNDSNFSKREICLKHIEYLEEELERWQLKRDKLKKKHDEAFSRYTEMEKKHSDASKKLQQIWADGKKTEEELTEQLKSQKQAWEQERKALVQQHHQRVQSLKDHIAELNSKIAAKSEEHKVLAAKSEECEKQTMELKSRAKSLEMENKELEVATIKEQEHLQKLKTRGISEEKVKRVAEINASVILKREREEMMVMSKNMELLQKDNVRRRKEIDALQTKLKDLHDEERTISENRKKQDLEDKKLERKMKQLEVELKDLSSKRKQRLATEDDLRREKDLVSKESHRQTAKARQLEAEIQKEKKRSSQLERVLWEADIIIKDILADPGDSKEMPTIEWKMERLLDIMESTAPVEPGSNRSSQGQKLQTKTHKPARKS